MRFVGFERALKFWDEVTLEPMLMLYFIVYEFVDFLETNLLLQKTCRFNLTREPDDLDSACDDEKLGQEFVTVTNSFRFTVAFYCSIALTMLASVWSDNRGNERRHMVFGPVIGLLIRSICGALNSYFWTWDSSLLTIPYLVVYGLTGGKLCMILGSHLYISTITGTTNRTFRLGTVISLHYVCLPIGTGLSGFMNTYLGFTNLFLLCALLMTVALLMGCWKVKATPVVESAQMKMMPFLQAISPTQVFRSFSLIFKKRPQHKRIILICILISDPLVLISVLGEQTVTYLYFRYRFGWHEKAYSVYTAYKMLGTLVGTMFCTVYMSKHLKIHDGFIGTLAAFWDTVGNISYFFADQAWELYVIPLYNIFNGVLFAMMASLATKCVEPNEMGYLTSVRSLMQIVSPLSFPLYGLVYKSTLDKLPNAFFLLSVGFNFPTIILFGIAYYLSKDIEFETASPDTLQSPTTVNNSVADSAWKKPEQKNQLSIS